MLNKSLQIDTTAESELIFEEAKPYLQAGKGWPVSVTAYSNKTRLVTLTFPDHHSDEEYKQNIAYMSLFISSLHIPIVSISYNSFLPYMGNQDLDALVVVFTKMDSNLDVTTFPYRIKDGVLTKVENVDLNTAVNPVDPNLLSALKIMRKATQSMLSFNAEVIVEFLKSKNFDICFYGDANVENFINISDQGLEEEHNLQVQTG